MRGRVERQATMVLIATTDQLVPADHPIRRIRDIIDPLLEQMGAQFSALYSEKGRHSVPPEHLVKGTLLMALYSIRSERQFCERLQYDMLFKWFLGLNIQDAAFDHSTFSKNRQRLSTTTWPRRCSAPSSMKHGAGIWSRMTISA